MAEISMLYVLVLALVACNDGRAAARVQSTDAGTAAAEVEAGQASAATGQARFELRVIGPGTLLARLQVPDATIVSAPVATAQEENAVYSRTMRDWSSPLVLRDPQRPAATLQVEPWLCSRTKGAVDALRDNALVTESRTIEVDEDGRAWSNGRPGEPFLTRCFWGNAARSGSGSETLQNGPCLCSEPERSRTHVEVVTAEGAHLSTPEVCYATMGAVGEGIVGLTLYRELDAPNDRAITIQLTHCIGAGETAPFEVTEEALRSSTCSAERLSASMGAVGSARPRPLALQRGAWKVDSASANREALHRSELDLTFMDDRGASIIVRGHVELPQILH